ncbi:hypothetical protein ILUMI_07808 [Ignelater luminosus]|uniref:Uncharacterized protein n=1 Tax=Ignelater luminosus TaxID=2038154 RepID=A0A8K0GGH7_IGNLU|nr:hypothetical protein ILUMI_07808 [Ignelater luminosus]
MKTVEKKLSFDILEVGQNKIAPEIFNSNSDISVMSSKSSDLIDIDDQIFNDNQEENFIIGIITENHSVVVKYASKKVIGHYVAQAVNIEVNFLRRKQPDYSFVFPAVQNIGTVLAEDNSFSSNTKYRV